MWMTSFSGVFFFKLFEEKCSFVPNGFFFFFIKWTWVHANFFYLDKLISVQYNKLTSLLILIYLLVDVPISLSKMTYSNDF